MAKVNEFDPVENHSAVNPEFEALYIENGLLRGELATLFEEAEYLDRVVIPSTQTTYLIKLGALRVELLQAQVGVMKIRRRIALLRSNLEHGEIVHSEALNYKIEREFREWDDRLRHEVSQIEEAKARFSSLAPPEDADEVRSVYRILSRKMNPEINPEQSDEARSFWPSIRAAYMWGDLFHLKALLMMSDDYPESYEMPNDMSGMRRNHEVLREKITDAARKLENVKHHPAFEWRAMLDDQAKLAAEQKKLRDDIDRTRLQTVALQDMLNSLELKGVRR